MVQMMWKLLEEFLDSDNVFKLAVDRKLCQHDLGNDFYVEEFGQVQRKSQCSIYYFDKPEQLIFIDYLELNNEYEIITVVLYPDSVQFRLKHKYSDPNTADTVTIDSGVSEKTYHACEYQKKTGVDYNLLRKLRHFRKLYNAYYFGEPK